MAGTIADSKGPASDPGGFVLAYYMYRDAAGQWRWYLSAANGRKVANSGEGYHNKVDCIYAINLVRQSGATPIYEQ